jgi:hypothetical protein
LDSLLRKKKREKENRVDGKHRYTQHNEIQLKKSVVHFSNPQRVEEVIVDMSLWYQSKIESKKPQSIKNKVVSMGKNSENSQKRHS